MARRTYENEEIRVLWDSSYCIHSARCIKAGEGVFDPSRRPWVELDLAATETIVAAIEGCPSGALRYERLDGARGETPDPTTTIVPFPNGPLFVRGEVEVKDRSGNRFVASPRVALCRCGQSQNQPFCDLSHRESGFKDHAKAPAPDREAAANPAEISDSEL
jgi:uncharacterized Fe-S cluster protein YjdI/CDGSH-type Zn-finger protein